MSDELMKNKLDDEEREVLKAFEQGETVSVPNVEQAIADAGEAARNTYAKNRRIQLRVTERDYMLASARAHEEGLSRQSLLSSVVHKYLSGRLVEKEQPPAN
ncbi:MAG: antitoxin [Chloroflexi bacterium]|nr:antitoxin [Chloroflexota bacterium]